MRAAVPVAAPPLTIPLPILVAAFCLIWSAAFAVSKLAMLDCPPLILVSARCIFAGAVVLAAVFLSGMRPRLTRRDLAIYAALGVANYSLYLGFGYVGMTLGVSAGLSALISDPLIETRGNACRWARCAGKT